MDTYRYQGEVVTLVGEKQEGATECTIRLADGTEKTVAVNEITVEPAQAEAPAVTGEEPKPPQS